MKEGNKNDPEFNAYKNIYKESINEELLKYGGADQSFFLQIKSSHLQEIIDSSEKDGPLNVLDFGCGHGLMHPFITGNHLITGVDPAAEVIEMAKSINPEHSYQNFDGCNLPFEDNIFDIAFAVCVFHHIPTQERLKAIEEMVRVTKDGGIIVIYEHNPLNPLTRKVVNDCPLDQNAELLYSRETISLFKSQGLKSYNLEFIIFFPLRAKIFRLIERLLKYIPLGAQYAAKAYVTKDTR